MGVSQDTGGEPRQEEAVGRAETERKRSRKLYEKPAFRFERVFETAALSCGKVNTTQLQCRSGGRKTS